MGLWYNVGLATFAAVGSFMFGYDSGVMTDVIASPNFLDYFNTDSSSALIGAINSVFSGGACIGSLQGGMTMDTFGRRLTIQVGSAIAVVGTLLQGLSKSLAMMLVGRILAGWAVGIMSMAVPVYQAETANPKIRGLIVGLAQQMIGVGFIVSTWIGYGSLHAPDTSQFQWRFPLAFQALPALILFIGLFFLPESPRYLIEKDREEEAQRILHRIMYDGTNEDDVNDQFQEIRQTILAEKTITAPGWLVMFKVPQWRTRLLHGFASQVFGQMTGINVIGYYQTIIYAGLGITGGRDILVAGIYNCVGPICNLIFITLLVDRVGRRKPLLIGTAAITLCMLAEVIIGAVNPDGNKKAASYTGVVFFFFITAIFSFSWGPISWVYMSEVMPMQIRGKGNALATAIGNWGVGVLWNQTSNMALASIHWKFYLIFVLWNLVITLPVVYLFFKETKQKSLEEIDLLFGERALGALPVELDIKQDVEHVQIADSDDAHKLA